MRVAQFIALVEEIAPTSLAKPGDTVGLQLGDMGASVSKVLLAVGLCREVVEEAADWGAGLILTHHPWSVEFPKQCGLCPPLADLVLRLLESKVAFYTAHSNLDAAPGGIADQLAERLGLGQVEILQPEPEERYKLVTFVPKGAAEGVYQALSKAGAGRIGAYRDCSFWVEGMGTFLPEGGAKPCWGQIGELCRVPEVRLEVVVPKSALPAAKAALRAAHPYEEPAYDLYSLTSSGKSGRGRIGYITEITLAEFAQQIKDKLGLSQLRMVGTPSRKITRVAIHTGSGAGLLELAWRRGAAVFVVGEISYRVACWAQSLGLALVELGHYPTDRITMEWLLQVLDDRLKSAVEVRLSTYEQEPFLWS